METTAHPKDRPWMQGDQIVFEKVAYHELLSLRVGDLLRVAEVTYNDADQKVTVTFDQVPPQ